MATDVVQKAPSWYQRLFTFFNDVMDEMRKVTWPDRPQLQDTTIKIIIFVLFIGAVIGIVDVVLQQVLVKWIPSLFGGGR